MKRDFADFWNLMWEAALGLCAAFALLNVFAPPQDLPWKPLDLNEPVGQATAAKVADFTVGPAAAPEEIEGATEACIQTLRDAGVQVRRATDVDDGGFCQVRGAVVITGGEVTPLRPGSLTMQCPLAVRYVIWDRQVLQPAAEALYGSEVAAVNNFGTYSCRRIYGSSDTSARPSEHARANALDIGSIALADGRTVSVETDWDGRGPNGTAGAGFLRRLRDGACRVFSTVLTPDYNEAHHDHLHLDGAPRGLCVTAVRSAGVPAAESFPVDRDLRLRENTAAIRISRGVQTRVSLLRLNELSRWIVGPPRKGVRLEKRVYGDATMATGTVKWFNPTKGFGFIQPESGGADVFVHITAVQKAGLTGLDENAKVSYELESQRGKTSAVDLKLL